MCSLPIQQRGALTHLVRTGGMVRGGIDVITAESRGLRFADESASVSGFPARALRPAVPRVVRRQPLQRLTRKIRVFVSYLPFNLV